MNDELYEVQLGSGEAVLVRPLSPFVRLDIHEAAEELYPDPDTAPYEPVDMPHAANAKIASIMKAQAARQTDGYKQALREIADKRWVFIFNQAIRAGMIADTPEGRAVTLERLKERRESALQVVRHAPDDVWLQTVLYVLFTSFQDLNAVYAIASRQLSEEALQKAAKRFRGDVSGARRMGDATD